MSDSRSDKAPAVNAEAEVRESVTVDSPPDTEFLKRRMLLKGAAAVPVVLTLRASPALASTSNCAVVKMDPVPIETDTNGATTKWGFEIDGSLEHGRLPWDVSGTGEIKCVSTTVQLDGQECPESVVGIFNDPGVDIKDFNCPSGGIIIAASSGGSFTH